MFKWFIESNRWKHFLYAIPIGFLFGFFTILGVACALEYKDVQYGNKWDWIDWGCTIVGGTLGSILLLVLIL